MLIHPPAVREVEELMTLATGDEKHAASATSTLDVLYVLYEHVLRVDPANPAWEERDRFILSKGHGPVAYYAVLARKGFFSAAELKRFMQYDSILGAHPDRAQVPGIEASTGSLGHGLPMAVGIAYALTAKGLTEQRVIVLTGDAELNEGSNWEAIMHAGAAGLSNLALVVVDNRSSSIRIDPIGDKLAAFGWDAVEVDGRNHDELRAALAHRRNGPAAVVALVQP